MFKILAKGCEPTKAGIKIIEDLGMMVKDGTKSKRRYLKCVCLECNTNFVTRKDSVTSGRVTRCEKCHSVKPVKDQITQELLHNIYEYKDGNLYYKTKISQNVEIGDIVGSKDNLGYFKTKINGKSIGVHRLIWIYFNKSLIGDIDHIDHNPSNNKIENLRVVTHQQNCQNRKLRRDNTSGVSGVLFNKSKNKWEVWISHKYLGCFSNKDEAIKLRLKAQTENNYHKNHGREIC